MKSKITFVITKSEIGGAQTWILELYKILNFDFDIYLITSSKGWLTSYFPENKIKIIPGLASFKNPSTIFSIVTFLKKNNIDVVISSSANAGLYSRLAKLIYPHTHIYVSHGWSCIYNGSRYKKLFCWIEKILSYLSDTILCISDRDKKNAVDLIGIDCKKIDIIHNKVTPYPQKEKINSRLKVLFIARMAHPKRADLLIDAAKVTPHMDFYFIGDGPLLKELKIRSQSSNQNIFFLGEINDFIQYSEFDIFSLISDSEGLPMSALEAGSAGLPLLMSNVGGCSELIYSYNNNANGLLTENNISDIVNSLFELSDNYSFYYKSAQSLRYKFDIGTIADDYINLIKDHCS